jgi:hypothetical protein
MSYFLQFPPGESNVKFIAASVPTGNDSTLDDCKLGHDPDDWKPKKLWDIGGFGSSTCSK